MQRKINDDQLDMLIAVINKPVCDRGFFLLTTPDQKYALNVSQVPELAYSKGNLTV